MKKIKLKKETLNELRSFLEIIAEDCDHSPPLGAFLCLSINCHYGDNIARAYITELKERGIKCDCNLLERFDEVFESVQLTANSERKWFLLEHLKLMAKYGIPAKDVLKSLTGKGGATNNGFNSES